MSSHPEHHEADHEHHESGHLHHAEAHADHHGHHHHDVSQVSINRLSVVLGITLVVFLAEVIGAVISGSLALLADAGHMLVDSAGLAIALVVAIISRRPRSDRFTWGLARGEVISAAFQAGMLVMVCISIVIEAFERLPHPTDIDPLFMAIFGLVGFLGNLASLFALLLVRKENLNLRAAFLEVSADSLSSVAVIVAAGITWYSGETRVDILLSFLIAAIMAPRALSLLKSSTVILLERTPQDLDLQEIRDYIISLPHVLDVHDLHVSTISSKQLALSAHVTIEDSCFVDRHALETLHTIQEYLVASFPVSLTHSTIQMDSAAHRDHEVLHHPC